MIVDCESSGKWILAGEHAVLRGAPALVFPLRSRGMRLSHQQTKEDLAFCGVGRHGADLELLFWGVLEKAMQKLNRHREELRGRVTIDSELPLGRGLGASAALCVVVGRWLSRLGWVQAGQLYDFCRDLENMFHGESSGVDIAVALENRPLHFERTGLRKPLSMAWQPHWALSYCGKIGMTSECVAQVKELIVADPALGRELDEQMARASRLAESALADPRGFGPLVESIAMAEDCFRRWGLTSGVLEEHLGDLKRAGAVAVKPTGSGHGGYVLSLWRDEVPRLSRWELVPVS